MAGQSNRMARPGAHFSLRDRDDTFSTVAERFEHATRIGVWRQPEMDFKCLTRDCALCEAHRLGQPEIDSASVGRHAWGEIQHVHDFPRKFISELCICSRRFQIYQIKPPRK
jgi:hypothetical protein